MLLKNIACLALFIGLAGFASVPALASASAPVHNVVLIIVDDLGAMDLGSYGSQYYATPHLDDLAQRSARFINAYAHPVCSPSRAALLTGQHPARLRFTTHMGSVDPLDKALVVPAWTRTLASGTITYAELFRAAGFHTGHIGKWHVGNYDGPLRFGFVESVAWRQKWDNADRHNLDHYTSAAEEFILRNKDKRFLLTISHDSVHVPHAASQADLSRWKSRKPGSNGQNNPTMAAMIEALDRSVGRIVDTLRKTGIEQQTAIIFVSDNGGLSQVLDPERGEVVVATSNLPLRGGKSQLYEGGIRVPLLLFAPGVNLSGAVVSEPVIIEDLMPTMLKLAGLALRPDLHRDALNLVPLVKGEEPNLDRSELWWHYPHYQTMPPHSAIRQDKLKLVYHYETDGIELFDLSSDPGETTDLASVKPEVAAKLVSRLKQKIKETDAGVPRRR